MRSRALASFHLNGGDDCLLLFASKNPILFEDNANKVAFCTAMVAADAFKRIDEVGRVVATRGTDYAVRFAEFLEQLLMDCRKQLTVVIEVFPREMEADLSFIAKVVKFSSQRLFSSQFSYCDSFFGQRFSMIVSKMY